MNILSAPPVLARSGGLKELAIAAVILGIAALITFTIIKIQNRKR